MRKLGLAVAAAAMAGLFAGSAMAQVGKGLSGPHYNLNIIGVPKDKTVPDMTGSNRRTIFVPLQSGDDVGRKIKIYYERNMEDPTKFRVKDGNATDDNEATILVPWEFCDDLIGGCTDLLSFDVYAVGLGKPLGVAIISVECTFSDPLVPGSGGGGGGEECEDALLLGSFTLKRTNGAAPNKNKPKRENITDVFRATGCLDLNDDDFCNTGDLSFSDIWIFNIPQLLEYFWDYDNDGLKLMQVRFYPTVSGSIITVP